MARYDSGWPRYVPVAERRRKAEREMEKLRKKGHAAAPIKIAGRTIAATFWGKAWCENLESYHDYESRLPRGRTYVRNGSVLDLQIAPLEVRAMVSGSSIYRVKISIGAVPKEQWRSICSDCGSAIDSLVELLQGRLSNGVMERLCRQDHGLFPKPSDIRFTCSCPDHASMCKHVAAVLYGIGARLDEQPELLFRLRAVNENDLIADVGTALPMAKQGPAAGRVLEADDISALFGLDMAAAEVPVEPAGDASAVTLPPAKRARSGAGPLTPPLAKPNVSGRQVGTQNEGAPEKPGVSANRAKANRTGGGYDPTARRGRAAQATSPDAGHPRTPTAAAGSGDRAGSGKAPAARSPNTAAAPEEATAKSGRQRSSEPAPLVATRTGLTGHPSSRGPRVKGAGPAPRAPQPVKWWLRPRKA